MWTQDRPLLLLLLLLLLLACCLWSAHAQGDRRQGIWDDPIKFKTKAQDFCNMTVTGQGEYTRLRLSCRSRARGYSCDFIGRPHTCRSYNKNPRHYFVQMMWGLRKLQNACQAPRRIKPHMCRMATDESQMVFSPGSFSWSAAEDPAGTGARPAPPQPARPQPQPRPRPPRPQPRPAPTRPVATRQVPPRAKPTLRATPRATPKPVTPPTDSNAKMLARRYCWRSLQGLCTYFIALFRK